MRGFVYALKHFLSLPQNCRGKARLAMPVNCQRTPPAVQWFRPTCEPLEDRILPSTMPFSTIHFGTMHLGAAAPAPPVYSVQAVSTSQINLAWTAVTGATGYKVDELVNGAWKQIAVLGNSSTSYSFTGLNAGTTYSFDLAAYNAYGTDFASSKSATTLKPPPPAPSAPTFTTTVISSSQINLKWSLVTGATGYLVDEWINGAWHQIASLGSGVSTDAVTGLTASTSYSFEVAAYNVTGTTWSTSNSATTPAAVSINHPAAASGYSAVTGTLFGPNGPSYLDVVQGYLGDCWLLASLAEVAARDPSIIQSMFTSLGTTVENGSTVSLYSVRLYNGSGTAFTVTVDTELPSGGGYYDHPAKGVLWVALAEKAYAEANGENLVTTSDDGSDSYNALNDGDPAWALQAITGQTCNDYSINPSSIPAAWNAGDLVVLCTYNPSSPYILPSHCYALVAYNSASSQPFQVYNPWGTNSAGWALGTYNGQSVYGLFNANATFLSQNYAWQGIGVADENGGESIDESLAAAGAQPSLDVVAPPVATSSPTAFAVPSGDTSALAVPNQAAVSPQMATDAQASNQAASDAIWAEAQQPDSVVSYLGESALLFGTYVV